jgi:chromosome segregation ATPase
LQADQQEAAGELEKLSQTLNDQEERLADRAHALMRREDDVRQERDDLRHLRLQLEAEQGRLQVQRSAWAGEREQLTHELSTRQEALDARLLALTELHDRCRDRYDEGLKRLVDLQDELATHLRQYLDRLQAIQQQSRDVEAQRVRVAEQQLALEQTRQEWLATVEHAGTASRRMERLRRRWEGLAASAWKTIEAERQALREEREQVTQLRAAVEHDQAQQVRRQQRLTEDQARVEETREQLQAELTQVRLERQHWDHERAVLERQVSQCRNQVENLARSLIDSGDEPLRAAA